MKTNFKIIDHIAVLVNEIFVDLHNEYDFVGLLENKALSQIQLNFTRTNGHWVNKESPLRINFMMFNVSFLLNEEGDPDALPTDKNGLSEITFCPSNQRDINTEFYLRSEPQTDDDILFCFADERFIRIGCDEAIVECMPV